MLGFRRYKFIEFANRRVKVQELGPSKGRDLSRRSVDELECLARWNQVESHGT